VVGLGSKPPPAQVVPDRLDPLSGGGVDHAGPGSTADHLPVEVGTGQAGTKLKHPPPQVGSIEAEGHPERVAEAEFGLDLVADPGVAVAVRASTGAFTVARTRPRVR
jgi:hypothetical protein